MTEEDKEIEIDEQEERGPFRRYFYRGIEVSALLDLSQPELLPLFHARARRRFARGLSPAHVGLVKRLRKARKNPGADGKPPIVMTHLRNMIVLPEMVGSVIGVHQGKGWIQVEVKPDMIGYYLGEFAITYKPITHGRPGVGATSSSKFIPLK